ncbi:MAG: hypothetical protein RLZZ450_320 [Pseudomonadota bacterium]|jgi:hypothetical protein
MPEVYTPDDELWKNGRAIPGKGDRVALPSKPPISSSAPRPEVSPPGIVWRATSEIFEPLPQTKWLARGLHVGPGRPILFAGYGASAKTLSSQSMGLAVASATPVWGHFQTACGEVRHLDYEQGWHATARRYQRLALGHGIDPRSLSGRLKLAVFPSVFLDSPNAVEAYTAACDGAQLVILDALRGATPTQDENDSSIRACLDNLTRVSEKTGTAFVVLHHAGKPKDGHSDARTVARGSSAIFDACGCVFVVTPGRTKDKPRNVSQVKQPAEAIGGAVDDFTLMVEDVGVGGDEAAGVRVTYRPFETENPLAQANAKYEADIARLIEVVRENQGATQNTILNKSGLNRTRAGQVLSALVDEGRVAVLEGERNSKTYRLTAP